MSVRQNKCPTCSEMAYFTKAEGVCGRCQRLIQEARERREWLVKESRKTKMVVVDLPGPMHFWPGFYDCLPQTLQHWKGYRDRLRNALARVYRCIGQQQATLIQSYPESKLPWPGKWDGWDRNCPKAVVTLRQYRAMKALRLLIDAVIAETYQGGFNEGKNLLKGLASGKITNEELTEHDRTLAERIQKHGADYDKLLQDCEEDDDEI